MALSSYRTLTHVQFARSVNKGIVVSLINYNYDNEIYEMRCVKIAYLKNRSVETVLWHGANTGDLIALHIFSAFILVFQLFLQRGSGPLTKSKS